MFAAPQVHVTKLLLHETGTYEDQWRRSYETNLDGSTLNLIAERLDSANKYMPAMMAGVAGQFVAPAATPEKQIAIVNGWQERRMRFMMEIENVGGVTGSRTKQVVLGHTNYTGVSHSGHVDPQMEFYVNSVLHMRETIEHTPMGNQTYASVYDSSHVLADNNWKPGGMYSQEKDQRMRPEDVYSMMSRSHLPDAGETLDMRTTMTNAATKSRRSNTVPANFMASILENYKNAHQTSEFGQGAQEVLHTARGFVQEAAASKDQFLSAMAQVRGMPVGNTFTFSDLIRLDPNAESVTVASYMGEKARATSHIAGQTMGWGGSDRGTQVATMLSQSIPSLLMDLTLTRIVFKSSNAFQNAAVQTVIIDAQGFSSGDLSPFLNQFVIRLEHEILKDISWNGQSQFNIEMQVDLLGETWTRVSLEGGPVIDYVTPSFCDALLVPVVTGNQQKALTLAKDFDALFDTINGNQSSGYAGNTIGMFGNV